MVAIDFKAVIDHFVAFWQYFQISNHNVGPSRRHHLHTVLLNSAFLSHDTLEADSELCHARVDKTVIAQYNIFSAS